jgi:hypothetical protein
MEEVPTPAQFENSVGGHVGREAGEAFVRQQAVDPGSVFDRIHAYRLSY